MASLKASNSSLGVKTGRADMKPADQIADTYSEAETVARMQAALKRALATPPRPHTASKAKRKESSQSKIEGSP